MEIDPSRYDILLVGPLVHRMKAIAENKGYRVIARTKGSEALMVLRASTFHIVLMELNLDDIETRDFLQIAKTEQPNAAYILLDDPAKSGMIVSSLVHGIDAYIPSPPDEVALFTDIARHALAAAARGGGTTELEQASKNATDAHAELKALQASLTQAQTDNQYFATEVERLKEEADNEQQRFSTKLQKKEGEIRRLKKEGQQKEYIAALKEEIHDLKAERKELLENLENMSADVSQDHDGLVDFIHDDDGDDDDDGASPSAPDSTPVVVSSGPREVSLEGLATPEVLAEFVVLSEEIDLSDAKEDIREEIADKITPKEEDLSDDKEISDDGGEEVGFDGEAFAEEELLELDEDEYGDEESLEVSNEAGEIPFIEVKDDSSEAIDEVHIDDDESIAEENQESKKVSPAIPSAIDFFETSKRASADDEMPDDAMESLLDAAPESEFDEATMGRDDVLLSSFLEEDSVAEPPLSVAPPEVSRGGESVGSPVPGSSAAALAASSLEAPKEVSRFEKATPLSDSREAEKPENQDAKFDADSDFEYATVVNFAMSEIAAIPSDLDMPEKASKGVLLGAESGGTSAKEPPALSLASEDEEPEDATRVVPMFSEVAAEAPLGTESEGTPAKEPAALSSTPAKEPLASALASADEEPEDEEPEDATRVVTMFSEVAAEAPLGTESEGTLAKEPPALSLTPAKEPLASALASEDEEPDDATRVAPMFSEVAPEAPLDAESEGAPAFEIPALSLASEDEEPDDATRVAPMFSEVAPEAPLGTESGGTPAFEIPALSLASDDEEPDDATRVAPMFSEVAPETPFLGEEKKSDQKSQDLISKILEENTLDVDGDPVDFAQFGEATPLSSLGAKEKERPEEANADEGSDYEDATVVNVAMSEVASISPDLEIELPEEFSMNGPSEKEPLSKLLDSEPFVDRDDDLIEIDEE